MAWLAGAGLVWTPTGVGVGGGGRRELCSIRTAPTSLLQSMPAAAGCAANLLPTCCNLPLSHPAGARCPPDGCHTKEDTAPALEAQGRIGSRVCCVQRPQHASKADGEPQGPKGLPPAAAGVIVCCQGLHVGNDQGQACRQAGGQRGRQAGRQAGSDRGKLCKRSTCQGDGGEGSSFCEKSAAPHPAVPASPPPASEKLEGAAGTSCLLNADGHSDVEAGGEGKQGSHGGPQPAANGDDGASRHEVACRPGQGSDSSALGFVTGSQVAPQAAGL